MTLRIIFVVIGSVFVVFGLVGLYQIQSFDCSGIKDVILHNDCADINSKTHNIFYFGLFSGLSLVMLSVGYTIKQRITNDKITEGLSKRY